MLLPLILLAAASSVSGIPPQRVQAAAHVLQAWYVPQTGLYRTTGWWNAANAITALTDAMRVTGSRRDTAVLSNTFRRAQIAIPAAHQKGALAQMTGAPGFLNRYYDDEGWWALAWIDAWDLTHQPQYLSMAASIFTDMAGGWDQTCGGGIWWSKDRAYKNAIANELFFSVAAHLAARTGSPQQRDSYIAWERREWTWFRASGMINANGLVNDGLEITRATAAGPPICRNNHRTTWTYNQGVIVGALTESTRTLTEPGLLAQASRIAHTALDRLTTPDGILREPCEPHCGGGDVPQFKGIFVRNLQLLEERAPDERFRQFFLRNAESMWQHDRIGRAALGFSWSGPPGVPDAATQSSALDALVAAAAP